MPTPGKLVALLLLSDVVLYLSDQYDWFAFNKQKGWTVLIAVACVMAGLGLIVVWSVGAWLCGRRAQFGLLILLLMVPAVGVPLAWLTREMQEAKRVADTIERIEQAGGRTAFFYRLSGDGPRLGKYFDPCENTPAWSRKIFGDEFFVEVAHATIYDRSSFSDLALLSYLRKITVEDEVLVTDKDLDMLASFPLLHSITLYNTEITDAGLKKLEKITTLKDVYIPKSKTTWQAQIAFREAVQEWCSAHVLNPRSREEELGLPEDPYSPEALDKRSAEDLEQELKGVEAELKKLNEDRYKRSSKSP